MRTQLAERAVESFEWTRTPDQENTTVPLDDFLTVQVFQLPKVRVAVAEFLAEHYSRAHGLAFVAARGKLIADFAPIAESRATFGEIVKKATSAVRKSELGLIRGIDPRDLARAVCVAA